MVKVTVAVFPFSCTVALPLPVTWFVGTASSDVEYGRTCIGDELELVDTARTATVAKLARSATPSAMMSSGTRYRRMNTRHPNPARTSLARVSGVFRSDVN